MRETRRKRNSPKTNLTISLVFHTVLILVGFVFAAREGVLGKKLRELTVLIAPEQKKPEPPKEKPPEPKVEPTKAEETPKIAAPVRTAPAVASAPPPANISTAPAMSAPPAANLPSFDFSDGAKAVSTDSSQGGLYRAQVEYSLRSHWNRPDAAEDEKFVAEVQLDMDAAGNITDWRLVKGSGDPRWDDSVKAAMKATPNIGRPRPKNFPEQFLVRFDVQTSEATDAIQIDTK